MKTTSLLYIVSWSTAGLFLSGLCSSQWKVCILPFLKVLDGDLDNLGWLCAGTPPRVEIGIDCPTPD